MYMGAQQVQQAQLAQGWSKLGPNRVPAFASPLDPANRLSLFGWQQTLPTRKKQDKTEATQSWCTAASNFDNLMSELVQQLWATLLETTENWELGERGTNLGTASPSARVTMNALQ